MARRVFYTSFEVYGMIEMLAKNISRNRKGMGLTQDALAEKLGVTYQAVSNWENGQNTPETAMLPKLAMVFGVSLDKLMCWFRDGSVRRILRRALNY